MSNLTLYVDDESKNTIKFELPRTEIRLSHIKEEENAILIKMYATQIKSVFVTIFQLHTTLISKLIVSY